jgi:hypothetical protein
MRTLRLLFVAGALALPACTKSPAAAPDAPSASRLDDLVVADPNFTFATRREVKLRLEPAVAGTPVPVVVSDSAGRRLFKGAIRQPMDLDFKLANDAGPSLTVVSGRGDEAVTQTVSLAEGRGAVRL